MRDSTVQPGSPDRNHLSAEAINAFVDGEFSPEDRLRTLQDISASETLSRDVCDAHRLKEMVRSAYSDVADVHGEASVHADRSPQASCARVDKIRKARERGLWCRYSAAAMVSALLVGAVAMAGFATDRDGSLSNAVAQSVAVLDSEQGPFVGVPFSAPINDQTQQLLLHLTESDPVVFAEMLNDVERLLQESEGQREDLRVQIVANAGGLALMEAERSPYPQRIEALQTRYPQLRFTACKSTIDDILRAEGRSVSLLPDVELIDSGVAEAARRQREGWLYIRV